MRVCPAPECGKPIADSSFCCLYHFKQLPYSLRLRLKKAVGGSPWLDIGDIAGRVWRELLYATVDSTEAEPTHRSNDVTNQRPNNTTGEHQ